MDSQTGERIAGLLGVAFIIALVIFIGFLYWRIASKAGYHGAMGLLMFVPLANIVMIIIFAFSEWPVLRELKELRMDQKYVPGEYLQQQQPPRF